MAKVTKKAKKPKLIYRVLAFILLVLSILFLGSIIYLNILSIFYLLLLIAGVLLLDGVSLFFLLKLKKKKLGVVVSTILILVLSLLNFYIIRTTGLISSLNLDYKTYNYSVIVLKNSSYQKLKDLSGESLGYYDDSSDESNKSLDKVLKKVELNSSSYEDTNVLANALLDGDVESVLLEDSYLNILSETIIEEDQTFQDMARKIYSFTIVTKTSDISKDLNVTKEPFNVYISGIDTYGEISSVSRSDVNMVVTVNPATQQILLTSIPRDYYVQLHGKSGYKDKLTHAGLYGTDMSIQTIEDLLDIDVNYYVKVNFSSVVDIVEAIGGVDVYSEYDFTSIDNYNYKKGYNTVNGKQALSFARERKSFALGDRQRVKNQQALIRAIFKKCTSKAIITKYSRLLDSIGGSFVTNMKVSRLTSLIKMQLSNGYSWNIVTNSLNGGDGSEYTYSAPNSKAYVMIPTEESIKFATELINRVLDGEVLDKETVDADASKSNRVTQGGGSDNKNSTTNKDTKIDAPPTTNTNQDGLEAQLGRSSVEFTSGEEDYTYYPYTATYNGKDITKSSDLEENFQINGKTFDDYQELVLYVSNLDSGKYSIIYTIRYQGESISLRQSVTILEPVNVGNTDDEDNINSDNNNEYIEDDNDYLEGID